MAWTTPGTAVAGDVLTASFWNLQVRDQLNSLVEAGTALPSSPVDGQSFYYVADTTNGIVWHLRYRAASASAYKWEFAGGSNFYNAVSASETRASTSYGDLATVGPSVTVPLAGDYEVRIGGYSQSSGSSDVGIMSYDIGATAASDARSTRGNNLQSNPGMTFRHTGLSANTLLRMKYRNLTGSASWSDRFMSVTPIRVG